MSYYLSEDGLDYYEDIEFVPTLADLINLDRRFEIYIEVNENGCWEWIGYKNWSGANKTIPYGRIRRPKSGPKATAVYVHRYVWELFYGSYPSGFETHHKCRNTLCCNPSHYGPIDPVAHDREHDHVANLGFHAKKKWLRQHKNRLP